jgi:hypothetical protein
MRRLLQTLRCKCARCVAARRRRFFIILAFCIAIIGSWKLLVEEHDSVSHGYLPAAVEDSPSYGFNESHAIGQPSQPVALQAPSYIANADPSSTTSNTRTTRVSRERMNAALAAGLIDPEGIGFLAALIAAPAPEQDHQDNVPSSRDSTTNLPGTSPAKEPGPQSKDVALAPPVTAPAATPNPYAATPIPTPDRILSERQRHKTDIGSARLGPDHRAAPAKDITTKSVPARFIASAGAGSSGSSSANENIKRIEALPTGTKPVSATGQKIDDRSSQSRDLSQDLKRFAADFVRANQTDNFAERHRFFADSVHFYSEGDLSLASVDAATRRHHRNQQNKRTEVAEPGAASGPVNGGFYEIEQPVRWTQSQESQVRQGRSVLRLRVVPTNGHWKITSIDEVNK